MLDVLIALIIALIAQTLVIALLGREFRRLSRAYRAARAELNALIDASSARQAEFERLILELDRDSDA